MNQAKQQIGKQRDLSGLSFAFFGDFAVWPSYHGCSPKQLAEKLGATICHKIEPQLDYVVIGDKRGKGRADAIRRVNQSQLKAAASLKKTGAQLKSIELLDEAAFREMVKIDLNRKRFAFGGGFDCCALGFDLELIKGMVEAAGAQVQAVADEKTDYAVVGGRRLAGKAEFEKQLKELQAANAKLQVITEPMFLELVRKEVVGRKRTNFPAFFGNLYGLADNKKIERAVKMLKKESYQLYHDVSDEMLIGVVRSQTNSESVYAPWLKSSGAYGCSTTELTDCMGLQGSICKHLLVLLIGLTKAEVFDPTTASKWVQAATKKRPQQDHDAAAATLIKYKGVETGEVDWRPTETIPEDYYTL